MSEKLISQSSLSEVYLSDKFKGHDQVILKFLKLEFPTPEEIKRFYNEYEVTEGLNLKYSRVPIQKFKRGSKHGIVFKYARGESLKSIFAGQTRSLEEGLSMAIQVCHALSEIHSKNIIHKSINSNNIIVNLHTKQVSLIDFGLSSRIRTKERHLEHPDTLEGNLSYISPEQTGRMNRVVDYRTDLYSFGVTLYEVVTGKLPFIGDDSLHLVHSHMAMSPVPPSQHRADLPQEIDQVVLKCLSKNAEGRYQSALGIIHDLKECLLLVQGKEDTSFALGEKDYSGHFIIPEKLYGRKDEIKSLMDSFDRVSEGPMEIMLISGFSGTGKSALVHEIYKPITKKRGYFIEGKFDQFQRSVPYFAFIEAFKSFVDLLLSEPEAKLKKNRYQILEALGHEAKVLTDVIPNLIHLIGEPPDVPELGGSEAQNRFNFVMRNFVEVISSKEHPIVLFIDDLQWADSASLDLFKILLTDKNNQCLLFIGAYRDNEVTTTHPFIVSLESIRDSGTRQTQVEIKNLSLDHIQELCSDSLLRSKEDVLALSKLILERTDGNVFFIIQFLQSLYEKNIISFQAQRHHWEWDIRDLKNMDVTENVVDLLTRRIAQLDSSVQDILKLSSCIGNTFKTSTLKVISEQTDYGLDKSLNLSIQEGLLIPVHQGFRFSHDKIQQAVYSMIAEDEKNAAHLKIGKRLFKEAGEAAWGELLFDVTNQWNWGMALIENPEDKSLLCRLNYQAGMKAKKSAAYSSALDYFLTAIELLGDHAWKNSYLLTIDLYTHGAEAAYLCGDFVRMDKMVARVKSEATDTLDLVAVYETQVLSFKARNDLIQAISTGKEILEKLGVYFPKKATKVHVIKELVMIKLALVGKNRSHLEHLNKMSDKKIIAAMRISAGIASCAYWAKPDLFPLVIFNMVKMSLKYGNTSLSAFAFSTYGVILCGVLGQMEAGHRFGKLGLALLERFDAKEWKTQVFTPVYALIVNWNEHIHKTLPPLQESYHIGLETGAIEFACINANIYCIHSFLSARPLERLIEETDSYSQAFDGYKQETNYNYNQVYHQTMLNFVHPKLDPTILSGEAYNEDTMIVQNHERADRTGIFFYHFNKLILCYYFGHTKSAIEHAESSRLLIDAVLAKFEISNLYFYQSLSLLRGIQENTGSDKKKSLKRVRKNLKKLLFWAKSAPENYRHKAHLVEAELARVLKKGLRAREYYDLAIQGASTHQYIHEEALAFELSAQFHVEEGLDKLVSFYVKSSYFRYQEWGAKAKMEHLKTSFPNYLGHMATQGNQSYRDKESPNATIGAGEDLDLATILKASTVISGEIVLSKLLKVLMTLLAQNAGAQTGHLLLKNGDEMRLQASIEMQSDEVSVLQNKPLSDCLDIASSIVSYVQRTKESVVVDHAQNDVRTAYESALLERKTLSLLCTPVIAHGEIIGVIYLENRLSANAFTKKRVDTLSLLAGQIAVSIDNAMHYDELEKKVSERTMQLAEEKNRSDKLLLNILPKQTAEELKLHGKTFPHRYEFVTVIFTDFKGFTMLSEKLTPEALVSEIDECFSAFDQIMKKHKVEKIKTIGDSYMAVAGLPTIESRHAEMSVMAALEVNLWMSDYQKRRSKEGLPYFEMRTGCHSGPVVAGVVGTDKFAYDIWGDTVNTASRMESSGEPGKVNVSGETYELIKDRFDCEYRGKVSAKNKGEVDMYFIKGSK